MSALNSVLLDGEIISHPRATTIDDVGTVVFMVKVTDDDDRAKKILVHATHKAGFDVLDKCKMDDRIKIAGRLDTIGDADRMIVKATSVYIY